MARTVEERGATVDEAVSRALDALGRTRAEVDVEILREPRRGLLGAGRRAHVRVTDRTATEDQRERTDRDSEDEAGAQQHPAPSPSDDTKEDVMAEETTEVATEERPEADEQAPITPEERMAQLDDEADLAADFVEGLLDRLDLPGDIEIEVSEDQAFVTVQDVGSGLLIGRRGATLDALQELVRCAIQRQTERRSHVRVDVEGYRARHLDKLRDKCRDAIAQVRETGDAVRLEPMDAYERKMMHELVAKTGGVSSSSEGNEPRRRVVIEPEGD